MRKTFKKVEFYHIDREHESKKNGSEFNEALPFTFSLNEEHATDNKTCNRT
jgi:hypothetical protein